MIQNRIAAKLYRQGLADGQKAAQALKAETYTPEQMDKVEGLLSYLQNNRLLEIASNIDDYLQPQDPSEDPLGLGNMGAVWHQFGGIIRKWIQEYGKDINSPRVSRYIDLIFSKLKEGSQAWRMGNKPTDKDRQTIRNAMAAVRQLRVVLDGILSAKPKEEDFIPERMLDEIRSLAARFGKQLISNTELSRAFRYESAIRFLYQYNYLIKRGDKYQISDKYFRQYG